MAEKSKSSTYIYIMIESLEKKIKVLDDILAANEVQSQILAEGDLDTDRFEENLKLKGDLIDELNKLDDGFQDLYDRIKEDVTENKAKYKEEIVTMQNLIRQITDKSVEIQNGEKKNKDAVIRHFTFMKDGIRKSKVNLSAASSYYKSMSKLNHVDSQFLDKRE